ncbi:MAG TPA: ABC transporter ATP-binding protein [Oligoflexus sp.]|uniref:ABC transporter ATP-binding protein n=1 Tax=Oligoflexus sp. TaxID=1971216 RepID=UPI002D808FC4|nr:ABC transporter ATP-binding protein [Oligoflexus sp.]HET9240766.1 ABC transporter ATP-binding protein [Oligoflexus sp.]
MNQPLLSIENLKVAYGPTEVLHGVTLDVKPGEIVTLIGSNGAGKTTLLKSLFGAPRAREGRIVFRGEDITAVPTHRVARRGLSLVPEGRHIFPAMSVVENLKMGLTSRPNPTGVEEDLQTIFKLFPRLEERSTQRAGTLSGGEQQMLAIGRSLMAKPELLLLDEPSLGLAPLVVKAIFETLKQVASQGMTIFLVEQNANQALRLADRAYVLTNGRITLTGQGLELLANKDVQKAYLGGH